MSIFLAPGAHDHDSRYDGVFDGYWRLARLGRLSLAGYDIDLCAKASRSVQVTRHEEVVIPKPMIRHHESVPYLVSAM